MRASLAQLHQQLGVTTVYVTHDQVEAMTLGQRVAVMRDGRILQVDAPQRLYEEPRDVFVAGLHRLAGDEPRRGRARRRRRRLRRAPDPARPRRGGPARRRARVVLGIRPESFEDAAFAPRDLPDARRRRRRCSRSSARTRTSSSTSTPDRVTAEALARRRTRTRRSWPRSASLLTARVDPRTRRRVGERLSSPSTRAGSTSSTRRRARASSSPRRPRPDPVPVA